jgi:hypothetical protein
MTSGDTQTSTGVNAVGAYTATLPEVESEPTALDEFVPLKQLAAELPRRRAGRKTHVATLYRWTERGFSGAKLLFVQIGQTCCSTRAWLNEFLDQMTRQARGGASSPPLRTPVERRKAIEAAERELEKLGV